MATLDLRGFTVAYTVGTATTDTYGRPVGYSFVASVPNVNGFWIQNDNTSQTMTTRTHNSILNDFLVSQAEIISQNVWMVLYRWVFISSPTQPEVISGANITISRPSASQYPDVYKISQRIVQRVNQTTGNVNVPEASILYTADPSTLPPANVITLNGTNVSSATLNGANITLPLSMDTNRAGGETYTFNVSGAPPVNTVRVANGGNLVSVSNGQTVFSNFPADITIGQSTTLTALGRDPVAKFEAKNVRSITVDGVTTSSFPASVDVGGKQVVMEGEVRSLTITNIPSTLTLTLNGMTMAPNIQYGIESDSVLVATVTATPVTLSGTAANQTSFTLNSQPLESPFMVTLTGNNILNAVGATAMPNVTIDGENLQQFIVNGQIVPTTSLPHTFTPVGASNIFALGNEEAGDYTLTIAGQNIEGMTINGVETPLPFTGSVSENLTIGIAGEIYQVDIEGLGGATITKNGVQVTDGNQEYHEVFDIDEDTYFVFDGEHTINVDGDHLHSMTINGISVPVDDLPVVLKNRNMVADIDVFGSLPSEVHIIGDYIDSATIDGVPVQVTPEGHFDVELTTEESNHFISVNGSQPREYGITFNDNGSTSLYIDGRLVVSGTTEMISKDVFVEALARPIPVHFEVPLGVELEINGREYLESDFVFNVQSATEVDIFTNFCQLTVIYPSAMYTIVVPQGQVTLTAPHRDGLIFDSWSSTDAPITGDSKAVQTTINLSGRNFAQVTAHYQNKVTWNAPNTWN